MEGGMEVEDGRVLEQMDEIVKEGKMSERLEEAQRWMVEWNDGWVK